MISIGDFSMICRVSKKTLRYYAEIGLLMPVYVNDITGYRYYSEEQVKTMLFIQKLKCYRFSLKEIKELIEDETQLLNVLEAKKEQLNAEMVSLEMHLKEITEDIKTLKRKDDVYNITLVDVNTMSLLTSKCYADECEVEGAYKEHFSKLLKKQHQEALDMTGPPLVMFHQDHFDDKMPITFALQVSPSHKAVEFTPGLCVKTVLKGSYKRLPFVYADQIKWIEHNGYEVRGPLFEVYINDPTEVIEENLVTEVYCPVNKRLKNE